MESTGCAASGTVQLKGHAVPAGRLLGMGLVCWDRGESSVDVHETGLGYLVHKTLTALHIYIFSYSLVCILSLTPVSLFSHFNNK